MKKYAVSAVICSRVTAAGLFILPDRPLELWEIPTAPEKSGQFILFDLSESIAAKLKAQHISELEIEGIALYVPCAVTEDGEIEGCGELSWDAFNVSRRLSILTGMKVRTMSCDIGDTEEEKIGKLLREGAHMIVEEQTVYQTGKTCRIQETGE